MALPSKTLQANGVTQPNGNTLTGMLLQQLRPRRKCTSVDGRLDYWIDGVIAPRLITTNVETLR